MDKLVATCDPFISNVWPVETPQGGEELALCYYKNIADPEVRGWIYLKDMTEIAEIQDTIILTSVARTLYLYAQTRAQHNVWVTGLAKLCPEAFVKLGREEQKKTCRAVPLGANGNMCRLCVLRNIVTILTVYRTAVVSKHVLHAAIR